MTKIYPVVRKGALLYHELDGERIPLSIGQAEAAVQALQNTELLSSFAFSIENAAKRAAAGGQLPLQFVEGRESELKTATRSSLLGPIFDFAEVPLQMGDRRVSARTCIAFCASNDSTSYSKIWTRFIFADNVNSEGEQTIQPNAIADIDLWCQQVADGVLAGILSHYTGIIKSVIGEGAQVRLDPQRLTMVAVNNTDSDFTTLYEAASAGERLSERLSRSNSAKHLVEIAEAVLGQVDEVNPSLDAVRQRLGAGARFVLYGDARNYRGLFIARQGKDCLSYVGLAQPPSHSSAKRSPKPNTTEAAANVVTAGLATEVGAYY